MENDLFDHSDNEDIPEQDYLDFDGDNPNISFTDENDVEQDFENKSLRNRIIELESYSAELAKTNDKLQERINTALTLAESYFGHSYGKIPAMIINTLRGPTI